MADQILGIHHITAIAGSAQRNYDFYTKLLGLRMVKKTVNFDDPKTYHFYFGDKVGSPGTILTFFPWEGMQRGRTGVGMATEIGYAVPVGSLPFWEERFNNLKVTYTPTEQRFGEDILSFEDPDGLKISLLASENDSRASWTTAEVSAEEALKGFHAVTLSLKDIQPTAEILTDVFGYQFYRQEGKRYRFITPYVENAAVVDLLESDESRKGIGAAGTNHHVAFRVKDDQILMNYREKIASLGLHITPKINRDYFFSLYFREPGGVLFEIATDNPGFSIDEPVDELGTSLKLPKQYEGSRQQIEQILPKLV